MSTIDLITVTWEYTGYDGWGSAAVALSTLLLVAGPIITAITASAFAKHRRARRATRNLAALAATLTTIALGAGCLTLAKGMESTQRETIQSLEVAGTIQSITTLETHDGEPRTLGIRLHEHPTLLLTVTGNTDITRYIGAEGIEATLYCDPPKDLTTTFQMTCSSDSPTERHSAQATYPPPSVTRDPIPAP